MTKMLSKTTSSGETAFPWKLHMVLEESAFEGSGDIISWIGDNAFKVHDPIQFEESIMHRYFNQTLYKSFQRQLNIYGFTRLKTAGKATGSYTHPLFIRGNPDACCYMVRVKVKKKGIRKYMDRSINRNKSIGRSQSFNDLSATKQISSSLSNIMSKSLNNCYANNDIIEPTPLLPSVSLSSVSNAIFEPSPISVGSTNAFAMQSTPIDADINIVPCENPVRSSTNIYGDNKVYRKRRHTNNAEVELDLDTIFDDDTRRCFQSIFINNSYNNNYQRNKCSDNNGIGASSVLSNPFAAMQNNAFDKDFHMLEESTIGGIANRMVNNYVTHW